MTREQQRLKRYRESPRGRRVRQAEAHRRLYGLSQEEYLKLLQDQGGVCCICRVYQEKSLCVDHDHITNKPRGLLCRTCNLGIGHFKDSSDLLHKASVYLWEHQHK